MAARTEKRKRDVAIMGTNNSSIVSKRSAEKMYSDAPAEAQFLRYFVPKPQRRSPLINRGYWLRMKAVQYAVTTFLNEQIETKRRIIVNLGCGYDPLPFEYQNAVLTTSRDDQEMPATLFVDVDYPDLIQRKCETIQTTAALLNKLHNPVFDATAPVKLRSDEYLAVGFDLSNIQGLQDMFVHEKFDQCSILFTSEVAITYMPKEGADNLIAWASTLPDARFSLLEQIMPSGPAHPFASTMLAHFNGLSTHLKSISSYPSLKGQIDRFKSRGWMSVVACDLWEFWNFIMTELQKLHVEITEAFDEWEELAMYGQHYFLLLASTKEVYNKQFADQLKMNRMHYQPPNDKTSDGPVDLGRYQVLYSETAKIERRFGGVALLTHNKFVIHGGLDNTTRSGVMLSVSKVDSTSLTPSNMFKPSPRMCHTLTKLEDSSLMLVGGRTSPDTSLSDCWLYRNAVWIKVQDMPSGRFRHSACAADGNRLLVFGGKSGRHAFTPNCLIWCESLGWQEALSGNLSPTSNPSARWAASSSTVSMSSDATHGIITGGMSTENTTLDDFLSWRLVGNRLTFEPVFCPPEVKYFASRFGSVMVTLNTESCLLVGGIHNGLSTPCDHRALRYSTRTGHFSFVTFTCIESCKMPMLIGFGVVALEDGSLAIAGGGGVCFSFGSYWNHGIYQLVLPSKSEAVAADWNVQKEGLMISSQPAITTTLVVPRAKFTQTLGISTLTLEHNITFESTIQNALPFIMHQVNIGPCTDLWDHEYLKGKVGMDRKVIVHESTANMMNFQEKNFKYSTLPFSEFIDAAFSSQRKLYLRSLSDAAPTKKPALLKEDFPGISEDFIIPKELGYIVEREFSSPLRISSADIGLWLHYDVHSNVLFSVRGRKKLLLFPPSDVQYLKIPHGLSTSAIDNIFENIPAGSTPYECIMEPGDALYIPPLWLHAAMPLTPCIAVNVFFKTLPEQAYSNINGKDLYGNKDLLAYEKGRGFIAKLLQDLEKAKMDGATKARYLRLFGQRMQFIDTKEKEEPAVAGDYVKNIAEAVENKWKMGMAKVLKEFMSLSLDARTFYMERLVQELFDDANSIVNA